MTKISGFILRSPDFIRRERMTPNADPALDSTLRIDAATERVNGNRKLRFFGNRMFLSLRVRLSLQVGVGGADSAVL